MTSFYEVNVFQADYTSSRFLIISFVCRTQSDITFFPAVNTHIPPADNSVPKPPAAAG